MGAIPVIARNAKIRMPGAQGATDIFKRHVFDPCKNRQHKKARGSCAISEPSTTTTYHYYDYYYYYYYYYVRTYVLLLLLQTLLVLPVLLVLLVQLCYSHYSS